MSKKRNPKDPHAAREAQRYANPIPSREFILDFLRDSIGPMTHSELCKALKLRDEEAVEALRRRLIAMCRDGQLVSNRRDAFGPLDKMNLVRGRVIGHPEGFGFVKPDAGGDDLFLSSRQMRRVMDGDRVLVRAAGRDRRGRVEASIVEVVERGNSQLVGRLFSESGVFFVRPENPRVPQDILVPPKDIANAEEGQVVVVDIVTPPDRHTMPTGKITEVLGSHLDPGMEIDIAIRNHGIPNQWPAAVTKQCAKIADEVTEVDKQHRVDLRQLPFVTIDGEDARDFDDAVYCKPGRMGSHTLYVAIADVSHYVDVASPLDREAWERGNSVYFPEQVVPMLPEKLSNGLCSLNPQVDRLAMVCEMKVTANGEVSKYQFYEAVIHSHARLTYTQVAQMIAQRDDRDSPMRQRFKSVVKHIDHLYKLFQVLLAARSQRGAIDFETTETRILFNAERKIDQIVPTERTDAHRLIEECMLCANVCAAQLLEKSKLPGLYRIHDTPKEQKLTALREFLGELGLGLGGGESPSPQDMQKVLGSIVERPDRHVIQTVMLRSMNQAVYDPENIGHFGLNYPAYTHFTSPIRRYPDLLTHRAIRHLLRSKKRVSGLKRVKGAPLLTADKIYPYDVAAMMEAGEHCSMTERRADEATREVVSWLKCEYLQEHVGDEMDGVVSAVTNFGLFVELQDIYIEGLVHITNLPKDYYNHDPSHHRLVGERTRRVYRLGDRLRVKVIRVALDERKIDFELVDKAPKVQTKAEAKKQSGKDKFMAQMKAEQGRGKKGPSKRPVRRKKK
ncbi:ribonuclease R [Porticoccus sp. W117]|uniref:ribonuclease R n=1 Tax=Porticoccus sp. W117 TaxID=3054777 RepID=UPI002596585E|nr:ribonuclease R [Porticoccus sp. W117]MDM3871375.1 ribonuclease R [Porticoccus sp. W117]